MSLIVFVHLFPRDYGVLSSSWFLSPACHHPQLRSEEAVGINWNKRALTRRSFVNITTSVWLRHVLGRIHDIVHKQRSTMSALAVQIISPPY